MLDKYVLITESSMFTQCASNLTPREMKCQLDVKRPRPMSRKYDTFKHILGFIL